MGSPNVAARERATLADVAREAGYPLLTALVALRPRPLCGLSVRRSVGRAVVAAAERVGYVPASQSGVWEEIACG